MNRAGLVEYWQPEPKRVHMIEDWAYDNGIKIGDIVEVKLKSNSKRWTEGKVVIIGDYDSVAKCDVVSVEYKSPTRKNYKLFSIILNKSVWRKKRK